MVLYAPMVYEAAYMAQARSFKYTELVRIFSLFHITLRLDRIDESGKYFDPEMPSATTMLSI